MLHTDPMMIIFSVIFNFIDFITIDATANVIDNIHKPITMIMIMIIVIITMIIPAAILPYNLKNALDSHNT
jgi:branched-subunit amino acid permease